MTIKDELKWQWNLIPSRFENVRESFYAKLAGWLPRRLVYFAAIRMFAYATTGMYGNTVVPELTAMDALERWASQYESRAEPPAVADTRSADQGS